MTKEGQQGGIRQVVRGERPWTDLQTIGMSIRLEGNQWSVENPSHLSAAADVHDLARGFLAHLANSRALREWAFVVEAIDVDLDAESHPAGETLRTALWDASFGNPISPDVVQTIERVAKENRSAV
jgi:hypothetical protein